MKKKNEKGKERKERGEVGKGLKKGKKGEKWGNDSIGHMIILVRQNEPIYTFKKPIIPWHFVTWSFF